MTLFLSSPPTFPLELFLSSDLCVSVVRICLSVAIRVYISIHSYLCVFISVYLQLHLPPKKEGNVLAKSMSSGSRLCGLNPSSPFIALFCEGPIILNSAQSDLPVRRTPAPIPANSFHNGGRIEAVGYLHWARKDEFALFSSRIYCMKSSRHFWGFF